MFDKKVLALTGLLVIGAALVLVLDRRKDADRDHRLGTLLLDPEAAASLDELVLAKAGQSLTLVKDGEQVWRIGDAQGFPADAVKLVRLFDQLGRTKYERLVTSQKAGLPELGLGEPSELSLLQGGQEVLALGLGANRTGGGQYVTVGGEYKAYLIGQSLAVSPDAESWEVKTLVDIDPKEVKSIRFVPAAALFKKAVSLVRDAPDRELAVEGLGEGAETTALLQSAASLLDGLSFKSRFDPSLEDAKAALTAPSRAVVSLFDGRSYEVEVGSLGQESKRYFIRIKGKAGAVDGATKEAVEALNALMASWAFELPAHVATRFERGQEDFVRAPEEKGKS